MHFTVSIIVSALFIFIGFADCFAQHQKRSVPRNASGGKARSRAVGSLARVTERGAIIPLIDHHQHIVGPKAVIPWAPLSPPPVLPPDLSRVIQERNQIMGANYIGDLYTDTARILDFQEENQPWVQGREAIQRIAGS